MNTPLPTSLDAAQGDEISGTDIPPETARRAVQWLVDLQEAEDPDSVLPALLAWRQAHSHHERAWRILW